MGPRRPRFHLVDLLLAVTLCGLLSGLALEFRSAVLGDPSLGNLALVEAGLAAWCITWAAVRARRAAIACPDCGRRFARPRKATGRPRCPRCRLRTLTPARQEAEHAKDLRSLVIVLVAFTCFVGLLLWAYAGRRLGPVPWVTLPLLALGGTAGLIALAVVARLVVVRLRLGLMGPERLILARARRVAGREGEVVSDGPSTIWYSGPNDPTPMLAEQMADIRGRFESVLAAPCEALPPLRILVFGRRDALVAYHRQDPSDLWGLDGVYLPAPWRTATLCTEAVPFRLHDPERTARSLFAYYLLESYVGSFPRPWLQQGLAGVLAARRGEPGRLNRRMIASLANGTACGADLFRVESREIGGLLRGWYDQGRFARLAQIQAQSWSLVELLVGEGSSGGDRDRFRAFLGAIRPGQPDEPIFERHFGHGFDRLLERWREWVLGRGLGVHEPPPPPIREALSGRLIPVVRDRGARVMDRIQAVRDLGRAGYAWGSGALIELLREPGEVPEEEVVWALESISGLALGAEPEGWRGWYAGLAREVVPEAAELSSGPVA